MSDAIDWYSIPSTASRMPSNKKHSSRATDSVELPPLSESRLPTPPTEADATVPPEPEESAVPARPTIVERIFGIDLRALGVFRILLAVYILCDLFQRSLDLRVFYTEDGVFPHQAAIQMAGNVLVYLSPYMYVSTTTGVAFLFLLNALCALGLMVGWRTRLMTFLTWYLTIALHYRNGIVLHSGDVYLRMLLFWGMFVPLGARFSVDGSAAALKAFRQSLPPRITSMGTVCLLIQIGMTYWFTVLLKTSPEWRTEGTAIYYALSIEQYALPIGQWLREIRWALKPLTHITFGLEILGPTLAFSPWATERLRFVIIPVMMAFHVIILNLTLDIGALSYICAFPWLLFLPSSGWDWLTGAWNRLPNIAPKQGVERVRERLIDWRNRRLTRRLEKGMRPPSLRLSLAGRITASAFLVYILIWNIHTTNLGLRKFVPPAYEPVQWFTRLDQNWAMFAPTPMHDDGWFVVPATTRDQKQVDLLQGGKPVSWEKPPVISHMYPNQRWSKYMMNLWGRVHEPYRIYYCQYLEREWNRTHPPEQELLSLQLIYMKKETLPDYAPPKPEKVVLWTRLGRLATDVTAEALTNQIASPPGRPVSGQ